MSQESIVFDTPQGIAFFALCSIIGRLELESKGFMFKRYANRTTLTAARKNYGLKGTSYPVVLAELKQLKENFLAGKATLPEVER